MPYNATEPYSADCLNLYTEILAVGVFTQEVAEDFVRALGNPNDAQLQMKVNALRVGFRSAIGDLEAQKAFVYLLAKFVGSYQALRNFFTYPPEIHRFFLFAQYVGPQLIKLGSISELMRHIRQTEVIRAAVQFEGVVSSGNAVKLRAGGGGGAGATPPPPKKIAIFEMIDQIRAQFQITDDQALYIREITAQTLRDPEIQQAVAAHVADVKYLRDSYRTQVNRGIQQTFNANGRYEELIDGKYIGTGGIFDIMAITVIDKHLDDAKAA